jgi:2-polyprenyl-6-methoxyphenol hydroxylase-like FAD-dependent oxidoreductase
MKTATDVLIAGAGPVGLLLATELARDGVDIVLIDRLPQRSFFCKALGVTPRTLEIFDDLGIAQDAIDLGVWLRGISAFDDGRPGATMEIPQANLPFGSLSLAQFDTERLLEACLQRHGGSVSYGWALTGFDSAPPGARAETEGPPGVGAQTQGAPGVRAPIEGLSGVRAQIQGPDGESRTIDCRWLVGCDGAHSTIRSTLGLDFEGGRYPQSFVLADLEVEWELPRGRMYRFNHGRAGEPGSTSLVAVPVHGSPRRYRLSTAVPESGAVPPDVAAAEDPAPPTLERVTALMAPLLPAGTRLSALHWSSVYRVSHRIVADYARGRVLLAGDAAHIHPPVGGQGMNTGLQDAHNLAWKLALASSGRAVPGLLDSYSAERRAVGLDVVQNTTRALNDVLAQRAQLPGMRETQLLVSYRGSAIVRDERADAAEAALAAGDRAPDAGGLRRRFVGQALRLHERLGRGRHVLVGFIGDEPAMTDTLADMLAMLRALLGDAITGFAIAPEGGTPPEREDLPVLLDAAGAFAAAYAARPGMAWLIRPDGYIGWCSAAPTVAGLRSFLQLIVRT